jgi:hypothetical protein
VPVAGRQNQIYAAPVHGAQPRELNAKEPSLAGFAPAGAVFAPQAHASVSQLMPDRHRLGIDPLESRSLGWPLGGGHAQSAYLDPESL